MFDPNRPIALIDMDETSFHFRRHANGLLIADGVIDEPVPDTINPLMRDDLVDILGNADAANEVMNDLFDKEHFWRDMPMIDGAHVGLLAMREAGIQIRFCTSPPPMTRWAARGKRLAIRQNFDGELGQQLASEAYIDPDKTQAIGTLLLDDAVQIRGAVEPVFDHVVYTRKSNIGAPNPLRINDWSEPEQEKLINLAWDLHNER